MKSALWRGDLLRLLAAGAGDDAFSRAAAALGMRPEADSREPPPESPDRGRDAVATPTPEPVRPRTKPELAGVSLSLLAPVRFAPSSAADAADEERPRESKEADLDDRSGRFDPWTPLIPWPPLNRRFRKACSTPRRTGEVDVAAVVRRVAGGQELRRVPWKSRHSLVARLWIFIDVREDLRPYRRDFIEVAKRCARLVPRDALYVWTCSDGPDGHWRRFDVERGASAAGRPSKSPPRAEAGDHVLALSDLGGCLSTQACAAWASLGASLRSKGAHLHAWTPCSTSRIAAKTVRVWEAESLEPAPTEGRAAWRDQAAEAGAADHRAEDVFSLLAAALQVDCGLLRWARRRLGARRYGAEVEQEVWSFGDFEGCGPRRAPRGTLDARRSGMWSDPSSSAAEIRREFADVLWRSRVGERHPHVRFLEALQCHHLDDASVPEPRLRLAVARLSALLYDVGRSRASPDADEQPYFLAREVDRAGALLRNPELKRLFAEAVVRHDVDDGTVAAEAGLTPDAKELITGRTATKDPWTMFVTPGGLVLEPGNLVGSTDRPARFPVWRGKLGESAHVRRPARPTRDWRVPAEAVVPESPAGAFTFEAHGGAWEFAPLEKPPWATSFGRDAYGIYADFVVGPRRLRQRMRWIPPGRFWMGSPEEETRGFKEHDDWKVRERRHLVAITKGYWLADTPCTQELWEEVMGKNPSQFRAPTRPVEQVSWDMTREFMQRLSVLKSGPADLEASERAGRLFGDDGFRLPSEAEWEYACRAGTEAATYAGDLVVKREYYAPLLHEIGWYRGNSGQSHDDVANTWSLSDWRERTFRNDKKGATHRVKARPANPFGLYDMIGNVWEWCSDWLAEYEVSEDGSALPDPCGPSTGEVRVIRGGSWLSDARSCRAAGRGRRSPGRRDGFLGFRLARGPWPSSSPEGGTAERQEAERAERPGRSANRLKHASVPRVKSSESTIIVREPVLGITMRGPEKRFEGRPIEYELIVTNKGDLATNGAACEVAFPNGVSFVSATDGGGNVAGKIGWDLGALAPKASRTLRVVVTSKAIGTLTAEATVRAPGTPTAKAGCSTVVERVPLLRLEIDRLSGAIMVGLELTYEITVTNEGSAPGTSLAIKVGLDDSMKFVSAGGATNATSNITAAQGGSFTYVPLGRLVPLAKATWILKIKALRAGDARLTVAMTATGFSRPYDVTLSTRFYAPGLY